MTIIRFFLVILVSLASPYIKATDGKENTSDAFYQVTKVQFFDDSKTVKLCELKLPPHEKSSADLFLKDNQELPFSRPYRVGIDPAQVQIHDFREEMHWKSMVSTSLLYELHLEQEIQPIKGEIENIFNPFLEKESQLEFGSYRIELHFDGENITIRFKPL